MAGNIAGKPDVALQSASGVAIVSCGHCRLPVMVAGIGARRASFFGPPPGATFGPYLGGGHRETGDPP